MFEDMIQTFVEETKENLEVMEEGLLELEKEPNNEEVINSIFRAMHTIKGGAGLMGLEEMSSLAHSLENVLDEIREGNMVLTEDIISNLFKGYDLLQQMVNNGDLHGESIKEDIVAVKMSLQDSDTGKEEASSTDIGIEATEKNEISFYKIHLAFHAEIFETGTDPAMLLAELGDIGEVHYITAHTQQLPLLSNMDPHKMHISWTIFLETNESRQAIDDIFIFVMDENDITITDITKQASEWFLGGKEVKEWLNVHDYYSDEEIEQTIKALTEVGEELVRENKIKVFAKEEGKEKKAEVKQTPKVEANNTIRVDTEKLENILNDLGELLIAQSRVKELVLNGLTGNDNQRREIANAFADVDKIIRIVQEEVMNTSMIPIGGTFMRFQRMVRDIAKEKGKQVELVLSGKETELDKQVIEQITDPLKHLLRNSIDHGIENPEEREGQGKDPNGTIKLSAYHEEGSIIIEISDDGKGIDDQKILKKAQEKGLVGPDQVLTKQEIYELLFKAGFSTAEKVTDISGRGVGLDVVITNIRNLRGTVHVESEIGVGTTIKIKLPLTLAIIDGMMVRVGEERFIIPLNVIIEFIKATKEQVHKAEGKGILVHLRDDYIPYVGLYDLLNIESVSKQPTEGILIIIQNNQRKLALLVDDILGQEQVVIKSIKDNMKQVDGVAGATILGDGNVALILDVPSLFRAAQKKIKMINEKERLGS